jgi:amino acid adenylation domain-containing protein
MSTMHHIASDGWSSGILIRELSVLYGAYLSGNASPLPELPIQYADFAIWQRRWLSGEVLASQLAYWKEQLGGAPPVLELPTDRPRPAVRRGRGAKETFALPSESLAGLKALVREQDATLFMGLLTVFAILLRRYTGQEDLTIGTPIAGRTRMETEGLIGFFVNTLVLRAELAGNPSFVEQLKRTREASLGAYAHQDLPFEQLVEQLEPVRDLSRTPLFQAMFVLQNVPREALEIEGLRLAVLELENDTAKLDLTLSAVEGGAGLGGVIEYDTDLFDRSTVRRLAEHLRALLSGALAAPHTPLSELPLQSAAELHQVLAEWNDTAAGGEPCVHRWIEQQAARSPEAVAVVSEGSALSYGELESRANRLGRHLRRLGVGPETVVGFCVERSVELLVGLLGILKAGGAYLPLDPSYPPERLAFLIEDGLQGSGRPVLLVERHLAPIFGRWSAEVGAVQVELDGVWQLPESGAAFESGVSPENLAYMIYTSGSTGKPKGVQVRHAGLANFLASMLGATGISGSDVLLATTTLSFDVAGLELYMPLLRGACVVVAPREVVRDDRRLLELLLDSDATVLAVTPAIWRLLLETGWQARPGFKALYGGEAMPEDLAAQLLAQVDRMWNSYGPTETTVGSTLQEIHAGERIGIGRPVANTQVYLLSRQLAPASLGSSGELCIGGAGVARGYAGSPELTAERFVPDPFSGRPGARLYKTGDLGRFRPEGRLDFLGRLDFQVKVRGFRIELGEIESVLLEHPAVREVVVLAREDRPGDRRLAAYLVPAGSRPSPEGLRGFLRERLPEYMVPSAFLWLEALPLTVSGKVDRSALPTPEEASAGRASDLTAPRTAFEELLAGIWAETLQVERVGVDENFFELGGHSLLAIRVISRIREAFGVTLPVRALFDRPTVEQLSEEIASALKGEAAEAAAPPLVAVSREGLLPLSFAQRRLWFVDQLEPGSAAYNLPFAVRIEGALAPGLLAQALARVVERHEVLRTTFVAVDGEPFQVIAPAVDVPLPVIDLAGLFESHRQAEAADLAAREAAVPFDLARGPLLRVKLLRLADGDQLVLLTTHHVVADGESVELLIDEAVKFYLALSRGERSSLRELPLQYADYASWQRKWLQGEVLERELAYWRRQLAGERSPLQIPMDHRPPVKRTHRGKHYPFQFSSPLSAAIRALCAREASTAFMFALAALSLLLSRYAGEEEVVVGVDLSSRPHRETAGLIGFFINMLVLRTDLSGDPSFRELLRRVRETSLEALTHQDMPYERLVEELRPERMSSSASLFQVVLNFTSAGRQKAVELLESAGLRLSAVEREEQMVRFDLMLRLNEVDGRLGGSWVYSTELFEPTTIRRLHERLMALIGKVVERPETTLSEIETEVAALEPAEQEEPGLQAAWQHVRATEPTKIRLPVEPIRG